MSDKRTLESDLKLIKVLFGIEPLDYARRDDGTLVIIHPNGMKTTHTPEEISRLSEKELSARSAGSERASREASGDARLSAASGRSTSGPTAGKKPATPASRAPAASRPERVEGPPSAKEAADAGADD